MKTSLITLRSFVLLFAGLTLSLAACGGGGGGGTTPEATITGTVLGTTVMAVDAATNAVVDSVTADPSAKTFSMQLAIGKSYKFYLLENEGTASARFYPVYVISQGRNQNVFSISQAKTINLGFMDTSSGAAVPALGLSDMENLGMSPVSFDSAVPSTLAGTGFGPDDMTGAWNVHGIADNGAWFHATMSIGSDGTVGLGGSLVSNNTAFGTALAGRTMSLGMTPGGVMNLSGDAAFNAFMGAGRSMFTATDLFSGAHQMFIAQKAPSGAFGTADLCNTIDGCTWQVQGIINGSSFNGWMQGSVVFDTVGDIVSGTNITRNDGTDFPLSGTVSVFPDGEITMVGSFHGTINDHRDTIVATLTDASGDACLLVLQRSTNTSHTDADFGGAWYMHNVAVAAGSGSGRADFGAATFDSLGNATMERFSTNPAFTTTSSSLLSFSMTVNLQGMMSGMSGFPGMMNGAMIGGMMPMGLAQAGFSGFMNADNSLFITNMTNTQGGNNWNMMILQR